MISSNEIARIPDVSNAICFWKDRIEVILIFAKLDFVIKGYARASDEVCAEAERNNAPTHPQSRLIAEFERLCRLPRPPSARQDATRPISGRAPNHITSICLRSCD